MTEENLNNGKTITSKVEETTINCTYTAVTSCHCTIGGQEFSLHNGSTYDLPDAPFVQTLIAKEYLKKN